MERLIEFVEATMVRLGVLGVRAGVVAVDVDEPARDVADGPLCPYRVQPEVRVRSARTVVSVSFLVIIFSLTAPVLLFAFVVAIVLVLAFVAFLVPFVVTVVVAIFDELDTSAGGDDLDIRVVVAETRHEVVGPRLEAVHSVDEDVRFEDCPLNLGAWFPPVAVLADRDKRLRRCGVTRDLTGQVPEHEERRLGFRAISTPIVGGSIGREATSEGADRGESDSGRDRAPPGVSRHLLLTLCSR